MKILKIKLNLKRSSKNPMILMKNLKTMKEKKFLVKN